MEGIREVLVERLASGGQGVGTLPSGKVVFIPRTAPGDRVLVRVEVEKSRWARGTALEWVDRSPDRRDPPCNLFSACDGCSLQHLPYPEQLSWKSRWVGDALRRIGGLNLDDPAVAPSPDEFRYRNRLTFTLRRLKGGRVVAGFRELERPGRVLDVGGECLLPQSGLLDVWIALRGVWGPSAGLLPEGRELKLTLRLTRDGVSLLVRGGHGDGNARALLERVPGLESVWREERDGERHHLAGKPTLEVDWRGGAVRLQGGGFLQVHQTLAGALQDCVLERAGPVKGRRVVDAYCGVGIIGKILASEGASVVGIDLEPGVEPWFPAAGEGGAGSFEFIQGAVEKELASLVPAHLTLLNPPRSGLDPEVPRILNRHPPERIVYVSCDPATLARDLKRMTPRFSVDSVQCFDLFPQTGHVETVAAMTVSEGDGV